MPHGTSSSIHEDTSKKLRVLAQLVDSPSLRAQDASDDSAAILRGRLTKLATDGSPPLHASELTTLRRLGHGAFAEVDLCELSVEATDRFDVPLFGTPLFRTPRGPGGGALVAVKWLKPNLPAHEVANFYAEAALLRVLDHPHIIVAYGCYQLAADGAAPRAALVLEYAPGGSLRELVRGGAGHYSAGQALGWLAQLARALEYAHGVAGHTIIHRDVKPDNVLLSASGTVRLADFGLFRFLPRGLAHGGSPSRRGSVEDSPTRPVALVLPRSRRGSVEPSLPTSAAALGPHGLPGSRRAAIASALGLHEQPPLAAAPTKHGAALTGRTGSPLYMAPENTRALAYDERVDVFSFGILAYELLCARRAYAELRLSDEQIAHNVAANGLRLRLPAEWTPELRALLQHCWAEALGARPTMAQLAAQLESLRARAEDGGEGLGAVRKRSLCSHPASVLAALRHQLVGCRMRRLGAVDLGVVKPADEAEALHQAAAVLAPAPA